MIFLFDFCGIREKQIVNKKIYYIIINKTIMFDLELVKLELELENIFYQ